MLPTRRVNVGAASRLAWRFYLAKCNQGVREPCYVSEFQLCELQRQQSSFSARAQEHSNTAAQSVVGQNIMDPAAGLDKLSAPNDADPTPAKRLPPILKVRVTYVHASGSTKDTIDLQLPYRAVQRQNGNIVSEVSITRDFDYQLPTSGPILIHGLDCVSANVISRCKLILFRSQSHIKSTLKEHKFACLNCTRMGIRSSHVARFSDPPIGDIDFCLWTSK